MTLEFLDEPYVYGNIAGYSLLAAAMRRAYTQQCEMHVYGSSLQSAPHGAGKAWYNAFVGEIIKSYGHIAGTNWVSLAAGGDDALVAVSSAGGGYTVDFDVNSAKDYFPPGIGNSQSAAADYDLTTGGGSNSSSDDGVCIAMRSPASSDLGSGTDNAWQWANIGADLTDGTWYPVDTSEGASLDIITCHHPSKTDPYSMIVQLKPLDPDSSNGGSDSQYYFAPARAGATQTLSMTGEIGAIGSGFTKTTVDFDTLETYEETDAGRIYNAKIRGDGVSAAPGLALLCARWRSRVQKSWVVSTFGVGGTRLDHVTGSHANMGPCLKTMGDPDLIYTRTGTNNSSQSLANFKEDVGDWMDMKASLFPGVPIVMAHDPEPSGYPALIANGMDEYFTVLMELVDEKPYPAVALNVRRVTHERGLHEGGALDPDDGNGAWMSDATHPNEAGSIGVAAVDWALMQMAAAQRPEQPRPRVFR